MTHPPTRSRGAATVAAVLAAALLAAACTRSSAGAPASPIEPAAVANASPGDRPIDPAAGIQNLDHLIFIVQENRSFDHYFGTFPGADGIPMRPDGTPSVCVRDPIARALRAPLPHDPARE